MKAKNRLDAIFIHFFRAEICTAAALEPAVSAKAMTGVDMCRYVHMFCVRILDL